MEQEYTVTFMKRGNERSFCEGNMVQNKDKIFEFNPDMLTTTMLSEKELNALRSVASQYVQRILELYI